MPDNEIERKFTEKLVASQAEHEKYIQEQKSSALEALAPVISVFRQVKKALENVGGRNGSITEQGGVVNDFGTFGIYFDLSKIPGQTRRISLEFGRAFSGDGPFISVEGLQKSTNDRLVPRSMLEESQRGTRLDSDRVRLDWKDGQRLAVEIERELSTYFLGE